MAMANGITLNFILAVFFGLLTAGVNAVAVITQHIASNRLQGSGRGARVVIDLIKQPLWWIGWIALFGSLLFQALALNFGPVGLVQPLLISELMLALLIRRLWFHQNLQKTTVASSFFVTIFLVMFIVLATPSSGDGKTTSSTWLYLLLSCSIVIAALVLGGQRGSARRRAGFFGTATAISWALNAVLIKELTNSVGLHGYLGSLTHWPVYAFIVCGAVGLYCEQVALYIGPLSVSQPCIVIIDPLVSVVFGVVVFGEHWHGGTTRLISGIVLLIAISISSWFLIESTPETMSPTSSAA